MKYTCTKPKRNTTDGVNKNENRTSKDLIVTACSIIIPNTHTLGGVFGSFPLTSEKHKEEHFFQITKLMSVMSCHADLLLLAGK